MILFGLVVILGLFATGVPIFVAFAAGASVIVLGHSGLPVASIGHILYSGLDSFTLLAIPFFVLLGNLMFHGGTITRIVAVVRAFAGHIPGGLGATTVLACGFMGAVCGSSAATVGSVGQVMIPTMVKDGYGKETAVGLVASVGTLGALIPPSITLIVYGSLVEKSVAKLFAASLFPGLIALVALITTVALICRLKNYGVHPPATWQQRWATLWPSLPALGLPVLVLGGIYGGIFTPTESASVGCVFAASIGAFIYRDLDRKTLWLAVNSTARLLGRIGIIIASGILVGKAITLAGIPQALCNLILTANVGPVGFFWLSLGMVLILGCFIEATPLLFIVVPLVSPVLVSLGIDLIHYGIAFQVAIMMGLITPPVGANLFMASAVSGTPVETVVKGAAPFLIPLAIVLLLTVMVPQLSLFLPGLLFQ